MLAKVYDERKHSHLPWLVQPKLNGIRLMGHGEILVSRGTHLERPPVLSSNRLAHIRNELSKLPPLIYDGELYIHGHSLQRINGLARVKSTNVAEGEELLTWHIFDYVSREPMLRRVVTLRRIFSNLSGTAIQLVPTFLSLSSLTISRHYEDFLRSGYEGMILRDPHMPYAIVGDTCKRQDARVSWMLKKKDWLDLDAVVVGLNEGRDSLRGTLGSFALTWNGKKFSAGSGLTDEERRQYWTLGEKMVGTIVKVQYEMLSDEGVPVKPVVIQVDLP